MTTLKVNLNQNEVIDVQKAFVRGQAAEMDIEAEFKRDVDFIRDIIKLREKSGDKSHAGFLMAMMYVQLEQQQQ